MEKIRLICHGCGDVFFRAKNQAFREGRKAKYHYCSVTCRTRSTWNKGKKMSSEYGKRVSESLKSANLTMEKSPNWKGGRYKDQRGYIYIHLPDHPHATTNGWVAEHIVVACNSIGRLLLPNETVHHKDENKSNNDPCNLEVVTRSFHVRLHNGNSDNRQEGEENPLILCACGCGELFYKFDKRGRPRRKIHGHNRRNSS